MDAERITDDLVEQLNRDFVAQREVQSIWHLIDVFDFLNLKLRVACGQLVTGVLVDAACQDIDYFSLIVLEVTTR